MRRWSRCLALAVAATATACTAAAATPPPRLSNQGELLALSASVRAAMIRAHRSPHIYRLATLHGLTFFRFGDSGRCYGATRDFRLDEVTPASVPSVFGGVSCWRAPSPVMDFSVVGASRRHPTMQIERLTGIASDEIRAVQLLSKSGRVLGSAPVERNVYAMWSVPRGAVSLRPVTRTGRLLPPIP